MDQTAAIPFLTMQGMQRLRGLYVWAAERGEMAFLCPFHVFSLFFASVVVMRGD